MNQPKTHNSHVQAWLEQLQKDGKSASTIKAYQRALHHLARWSQTTYGETFDPTQVIARDVRDWKSYQQSVEKAAPTTSRTSAFQTDGPRVYPTKSCVA